MQRTAANSQRELFKRISTSQQGVLARAVSLPFKLKRVEVLGVGSGGLVVE